MKTLIAFLIMSIAFNSAAQDSKDSLRSFSIEFDLHGCDCGAPDGYQTTYVFELDSNDLNPNSVAIAVKHTGAISKPTEFGVFTRVVDSKVWSYYNASLGMNLVLKWEGDKVVDAACIIGGQAKKWDDVGVFFDRSCEEVPGIEVYRWRLRY